MCQWLAEWHSAPLRNHGDTSEEAEAAVDGADEGYESSVEGLDDFEDILVSPAHHGAVHLKEARRPFHPLYCQMTTHVLGTSSVSRRPKSVGPAGSGDIIAEVRVSGTEPGALTCRPPGCTACAETS